MEGPLAGTRVVELASVLAGPSVGQFLAELGADVVKVENPAVGGDVTRRWTLANEEAPEGRSAYFQSCNWGKRSVGLDLRMEGERTSLLALAQKADVVISSYKPGDAARFGLDTDSLLALNPRLVIVELTGYGSHDPRAGYDAVIQAESGFTFMNGAPDGEATKMPVALVDVLAAHQIKEAVLVGLLRRERTGEGGRFEVSLLQSAVAALANQATNWLSAGHVPERMGSAHPNIAPYGTLYRTADGSALVLAVGTDAQFAALCEALEIDADERFRTNAGRVEHRETLDGLLIPAIARWNRDTLLALLAARNVPAGAVRTMPEVFDQPAAASLVMEDGPLRGVRQAVFARGADLRPPPRFGADTQDVLSDWLDADDASL
jgi:crotonobetainyl-CoA:carnitine CoA-transferase CaiB-like acyl-CoA transferase